MCIMYFDVILHIYFQNIPTRRPMEMLLLEETQQRTETTTHSHITHNVEKQKFKKRSFFSVSIWHTTQNTKSFVAVAWRWRCHLSVRHENNKEKPNKKNEISRTLCALCFVMQVEGKQWKMSSNDRIIDGIREDTRASFFICRIHFFFRIYYHQSIWNCVWNCAHFVKHMVRYNQWILLIYVILNKTSS